MKTTKIKEELVQYLLSRTIQHGECLFWVGALNSDGYPRFAYKGNSNTKVHKFIHDVVYGIDSAYQHVRHKCDNPICINPTHLEIGTMYDNVQDRVVRNRTYSKLSLKQVTEIRRLLSSKEYTQKEIGNMFGVNSRTVSNIKCGINWKRLN